MEIFPLLPASRGQWEVAWGMTPNDPGRARHIVVDALRIDGPLNRAALSGAIGDVQARQDVLRLSFDAAGSLAAPLLRLNADSSVPLHEHDLSSSDRLRELLAADSAWHFDLAGGPLWHARLIRVGPNAHVLTLCLSHLIADGLSSKIVLDGLLTAYAARIGAGPPFAAPVLPLAELHRRQNARLVDTAERRTFWRRSLSGTAGEPLFRPDPEVRPDGDASVLDVVPFHLPPPLAAATRRRAWCSRTTPFVVLMSAYLLLLASIAGRPRVSVSTASMHGVSAGERATVGQHAADAYVAVELPEDMLVERVPVLVARALDDAITNLTTYPELARAVVPDFDLRRPWPDVLLVDGNFFDLAYSPQPRTLGPLQLSRPALSAEQSATPTLPAAPWGELTARQRRVWTSLCGPCMEVNTARDGGVITFSPNIFALERVQALAERFVELARAVAYGEPLRVRDLLAGRSLPPALV